MVIEEEKGRIEGRWRFLGYTFTFAHLLHNHIARIAYYCSNTNFRHPFGLPYLVVYIL